MKLKRYRLIFTALAALALLATACSKMNDDADNGYNSATGTTVSVTLPIGIAEQETTTNPANSRTTAVTSPEEGFTVRFDEPMTTTDAPTTRTIAKALTNVWVLQFDHTKTKVSTTYIPSLDAEASPTTSALKTGTGYTIYVVANGPAMGTFTAQNSGTLDLFEGTMLHKTDVANVSELPLSGKLTGVSVVDMGDGTGKISLADATPAIVVMRRIHAEVTLTVNFAVKGYTLTGAELYNVPVGATYGWNNTTTTFPDNNTNNVNFGSTSTADPGMSSLTPTTSGTKTTYKWFIGDNHRGEVASLTAPSHRNSTKAPAYSTFVCVTLTSTSVATRKIYYYIYLGSGSVTNFDVKRNYTYTVTAAIKGTADFQEALAGVDARVSVVGLQFWLTDSSDDIPFEISPKRMESTTKMLWGPSSPASSISGTQDIYDGKGNTDAIMTTSNTDYPAAKYCRDQGWDLPAKAQLMLMWAYLSAIPNIDRPISESFWSSTEYGNNNAASYVSFVDGFTSGFMWTGGAKNYVRCVRNGSSSAFGSWKYPKVDGGNTIVSRDTGGGIKSDALLTDEEKNWLNTTNTSTTTYNDLSDYNKVSAKFQVASTNASTSSTWAEAYTKCKDYATDGNKGSWRLPTQRELILIWMFNSKLTGCGTLTTDGYFWSGTEASYDSSYACYLNLAKGNPYYTSKSNGYYVRCVRDLK